MAKKTKIAQLVEVAKTELQAKPNPWKGYVTGLVGGAAGTVAMGYYWQVVTSLAGKDPRSETNDTPGPLDSISLIGKNHEDDESSTQAIGRIFYHTFAGKDPAKETKTALSYIVHYTYGIKQGAVYGALRAGSGGIDLSGGLGFGTGLWLFGDEGAISLLGLADGPTKFPVEQHVARWGAHLVYGAVTALVARILYGLFK